MNYEVTFTKTISVEADSKEEAIFQATEELIEQWNNVGIETHEMFKIEVEIEEDV